MRRIVFLCAAAALLAACQSNEPKTANNEQTTDMKSNAIEVKEVPGRVNFAGKEAVITPQPTIMIATYDEAGTPNVMMAAWGGQCGYDEICFDLSKHKTTDNLRLKRAFTVSFASRSTMAESDYFGLVSGTKVADKVAKAGFTATKSPNVDAPIINEYPLTLECVVTELKETGNGGAFVMGKIVNMSADESVLTDGKVDLDKLQPLMYDGTSRTYRAIGEVVGKAWGEGRAVVERQ